MKIRYYVASTDSEIILSAVDPHNAPAFVNRVARFFNDRWIEFGMDVWTEAHIKRVKNPGLEAPSAWIAFLSELRVVPTQDRGLKGKEGGWARLNISEWHLIVKGPEGILLVPEDTVEKLIVLEEI